MTDVSFHLSPGETLGLVGESGSGKSVTALALLRLLETPGVIRGGRVLFQNIDILSMDEEALERVRGAGIGFVFQEPSTALNPVFTVGDQVAEVLVAHRRSGWPEARTKAVELLDAVSIPDAARRAHDYPHQLSGGMRQRVMIAIALACEPPILIADEPTTALDVTIQAEIIDLLRELRDRYRLALLLITHDLGVIAETRRIASPSCTAAASSKKDPRRRSSARPRIPTPEGCSPPCRDEAPEDDSAQLTVTVPALGSLPPGCAFEPRCGERLPRCANQVPDPTVLPTHTGPPATHGTGSRHRAHGPRLKVQGRRRTAQDARHKAQGPRHRARAKTIETMALVDVRHLSKHFTRRRGLFGRPTIVHAVDDVGFVIEAGETFGLVGESGSGKTTTARTLLRLVEPTSGEVWFREKNVLALGRGDLREMRRHMQIVFQDPQASLNPRMRVGHDRQRASRHPSARLAGGTPRSRG